MDLPCWSWFTSNLESLVLHNFGSQCHGRHKTKKVTAENWQCGTRIHLRLYRGATYIVLVSSNIDELKSSSVSLGFWC